MQSSVSPNAQLMPGARRASARRLACALLVLLLGLILGACEAAQSHPSGLAPTASGQNTEPKSPFHALTGPATAHAADAQIQPISTNPQPQLPVTLIDAQGTEVTVTDVSRILPLDLYGTTSRVLFSLGLGDNVVGRDSASAFPEIADRQLVTHNGHQLSAEAILSLSPTLIITDTSLGPVDVILQMRDAGIPVVIVDPHRSLETIEPMISAIAEAVGLPAEGKQLIQRTHQDLQNVQDEIAELLPADPERRLRIIFLYVRGQSGIYYMMGEGSGADSLIGGIGGIDVASDIGWRGTKPVNDEGIIAAAPDVIIVMTKGLESAGGVDGLIKAVPAIGLTPAGQNQRIIDMEDNQVLGFGPDYSRVIEALSRVLYAPGSTQGE